MDEDTYLREIEALVLHLSPRAQLLGDMDLHIVREFYADGVPLEAALAGIRKGADRLSKLKKPPAGLPLKRLRRDVKKELGGAAPTPVTAPKPVPDQPDETDAPGWTVVVRSMIGDLPAQFADEVRLLAERRDLGEERAHIRFIRISRRYYQAVADALDEGRRQVLEREVREQERENLAKMDDEAQQNTVAAAVLKMLISEDPVLDPERFWQD